MSFSDAIKTCFAKYADFNGRAKRSEFWWFVLFLFLVSFFLELLLGRTGSLISGVFSLATLIPSLAVGARRLHDTNRTGWWQLIGIIPIVGWIILIVFMASEGDVADNEYGAAP
jgi:uncharacterized membrane protein YhaH (DUF805 family)